MSAVLRALGRRRVTASGGTPYRIAVRRNGAELYATNLAAGLDQAREAVACDLRSRCGMSHAAAVDLARRAIGPDGGEAKQGRYSIVVTRPAR